MVELKDFISETLKQIVDGVVIAQKHIETECADAAIAPSGQGTRDDTLLNQTVEFDIAVAAETGKQTAGGIGIIVGAINLGSTGQSTSESTSTNRVKFAIPIHLPGQKRRVT